jgi:membrane protease YdiL (CAAX protease family)
VSASGPDLEIQLSANNWRVSRWLVLVELLLIALIFLADWMRLIPFGKIPILLLLAWISLRLRGLRWRDVGLKKKRSGVSILALGVGAAVAIEVIDLFVSQPLLVHFFGQQPNLTGFRGINGHFTQLLIELGIVWTFAAFGEEMIWRGYLMNRLAEAGKSTRLAWIVAMCAVNIAFGLTHSYQGLTGIIDAVFIGLLLSLLYLSTSRDLLVLIVAHGLFDTIAFVMIFLGYYPYM